MKNAKDLIKNTKDLIKNSIKNPMQSSNAKFQCKVAIKKNQ